jgi:hypothetical protein
MPEPRSGWLDPLTEGVGLILPLDTAEENYNVPFEGRNFDGLVAQKVAQSTGSLGYLRNTPTETNSVHFGTGALALPMNLCTVLFYLPQ